MLGKSQDKKACGLASFEPPQLSMPPYFSAIPIRIPSAFRMLRRDNGLEALFRPRSLFLDSVALALRMEIRD